MKAKISSPRFRQQSHHEEGSAFDHGARVDDALDAILFLQLRLFSRGGIIVKWGKGRIRFLNEFSHLRAKDQAKIPLHITSSFPAKCG
jgi:hypothetical protein